MTISQIKEILEVSVFTDPEDREYWEEKLEEAERKAIVAAENEKYFQRMAVYDRL